MKLIAFSGVARSGKDSAARVLIERHGFTRIAFADPMREALYRLNPIVLASKNDGGYDRLSDLVDYHGWDEVKVLYPEVRQLLQRFGTEAGRDIHGEDCWVNAAFRRAEGLERIVITDVRFDNEARAVHKRGGLVVKVVRPGVEAVNGHVSDRGVTEHLLDRVIHNDGTLEELAYRVEALL